MNRLLGWMSVALGILLFFAVGRVQAGDDQVRLSVTVTSAASGDPIQNASVYVRYKKERALRKDKTISLHVKTNPDGTATVPEVPEGKVLVQVIAEGWKTYGEFHDIKSPKDAVEVKLVRSKRWAER